MRYPLLVTLLTLCILVSCEQSEEISPTAAIPELTESPITTVEPEWNEDYYFPRFPEPQHIYVIRVETDLENWYRDADRPNWRVNTYSNIMNGLSLVSMQGIINRSDPSVYLDWQDSGMLRNAVNFWIDPISQYVEVTRLDEEGLDAVEFLWENYSQHFTGAVVYDPDVPDTINLATMIAGLEDRLLLAPDQLNLPIIETILSEMSEACSPDSNPLFLPTLPENQCVIDLRILASEQGWQEPSGDWDVLQESRYRMYQWVYDHLWENLEKRAIGMISPGPPSSRWVQDSHMFEPLGLATRDYLIALRLPALWLSTVDEPEVSLLELFMQEADSPIPILSFYDGTEVETTSLASTHGDWVPVISNTNTPISTGNLTILSAIDIPVQQFQPTIDDANLFAALGNQTLATLWTSDGDAIQFLIDRGFHGGVDFYWENVKNIDYGLAINPTLANLSPLAWNYYVQTAGSTSFVGGLSGAGYMYPALMDDAQLTKYLEYTARYMSLTGIRTLNVDERKGALDENLGRLYYEQLKPAGYLGTFANFTTGPLATVSYSYPGIPAPVVRSMHTLTYGNGEELLLNIPKGEPGTIFFDYPGNYHQGVVVDDTSAVGGQAVRFSREDLINCCMVIGGPRMTLAPGTYTATYRLKVSDNQSDLPFGEMMFLQQIGGGNTLVEQSISPSDFSDNGVWQNFSVRFTLDDIETDVQLWLNYRGGTSNYADAELYADTISIYREGGLGLPVIFPIFIGLVGSGGQLDNDLRLVTNDLEQREDVLLLTPDELMAALNPEFLIDWATPMLGVDDPKLLEARQLLDDGQILESLFTIREGLREFPEHTYTLEDEVLALQANAWVTELQLDQETGDIQFMVYSSPTSEINLQLHFPEKYFGETTLIYVDSAQISANHSSSGSIITLQFTLTGGTHQVQITGP